MNTGTPGRAPVPRTIVPVVMFCHFISAFAALGMPPFFPLILEKSLQSDAAYLAGWFYVVPTLFTALSSPWWGRLADRFGTRPLLIRAQLGLAGSFLLAGFAGHTGVFFAALVLQGVLGGTFAASNAYLATMVSSTALGRSLTAMQWSARAALIAAPVGLGVGIGMGVDSPIVLYRYLALLPLLAAVLIARLPDGEAGAPPPARRATAPRAEATALQIHTLQFAFVLATVVTFPYFIPHVQHHFPTLSAAWAGLLFGLPHLAYLALAMPLNRWLGKRHQLLTVGLAYTALILSLAGQFRPASVEWLVACRLAMGLAMTVGYIGLHALIAGVTHSATAGRTFGRFDSSSKWGGVGAGLLAGIAAASAGPEGPFLTGAAVMAVAAAYVFTLSANRLRLSRS